MTDIRPHGGEDSAGRGPSVRPGCLHVQHPDNPDRPLPMVRAGCAGVLADALLAAGVITDAADVRRQSAEDIAAAIEARKPHIPPSSHPQRRDRIVQRSTLNQAARLAREVGGDRG